MYSRALRMGPRQRRCALALTVALAFDPCVGFAQNATAAPLFQWGQRPDGVHTFVVEANTVEPFRGEVSLRSERYYPSTETTVRESVDWSRPGRHAVLLPTPFGGAENARLQVDGSGLTTSVNVSGAYRPGSGPWTYIAVVGLGQRLAGALETTPGSSNLAAAAGAENSATGEPWLPPVPSGYAGAQVVIASAAAVATAPREAQRALEDWVLGGGILLLSLRGDADARLPFVRALVGDDQRALARLDFGLVRAHGTGLVAVIDGDLSIENWAADPRTNRALEHFGLAIEGGGGGLVAPGDLSLWRRFIEPGSSVQGFFRPENNVRNAIGPLAMVFGIYILAVGLLLRRNRRNRTPLRVFWALPALGMGVLTAIFGVTYVLRMRDNVARVATVIDLGSGSTRAMRRVFTSLTAGRSMRIDLVPMAGHIAIAHTSSGSASGTLRWNGARLAAENARLSLWETGSVYSEGVVSLGGAVTVTVDQDSDGAVIENRTPLRFSEGVYVSAGHRAWRVPALAPGATVTVDVSDRTQSFMPALPSVSGSLSVALVDGVTSGVGATLGCAQYFAVTTVPDDVRAWVTRSGFTLTDGDTLVRVVAMVGLDPANPSATLPRPRFGAPTPGGVEDVSAVPVPEPVVPVQTKRDGGVDADVNEAVELLQGVDR